MLRISNAELIHTQIQTLGIAKCFNIIPLCGYVCSGRSSSAFSSFSHSPPRPISIISALRFNGLSLGIFISRSSPTIIPQDLILVLFSCYSTCTLVSYWFVSGDKGTPHSGGVIAESSIVWVWQIEVGHYLIVKPRGFKWDLPWNCITCDAYHQSWWVYVLRKAPSNGFHRSNEAGISFRSFLGGKYRIPNGIILWLPKNMNCINEL